MNVVLSGVNKWIDEPEPIIFVRSNAHFSVLILSAQSIV
jgi:hypothetical protein